ncbi:BamA/TamA family outer membrane protein [Chryseosolibacter indicus]|uniref:BamA/TamA family outer membrane protein n=1 Tax=Chryseosolibacter indicus TaxID=2782351 RepID=A0ABS5VM20_9BACT|nr:BamA/TamA family outer membrane protein [Chryseosolibacter indicus]MBT1701764.1 BamA/TamA family outer membrane protein [Chryseosolibacter indicus]
MKKKIRSSVSVKSHILSPVLYVIISVFFSGCSALKLVPENQVLYTKSEVKLIPSGRVRAQNKIKELLYNNVNPKPNTSIFGMRPALWVYYKMGEPKKGLKRFIKNKIGQAPVYMSDVNPEKTANLLKGHLINNGYFQSEVESKTEIDGKKGSVLFTAYVHRPYRLRKIETPKMDTLFANIDSVMKDSYLKRRQRYNLDRLQAELTRLEEAMENAGFYYFDDRHLIFEADSTVGRNKVDLTLMLESGVPAKAKRKYKLGQINVFPNYNLTSDTTQLRFDSTRVDGYNYFDRDHIFRPHTITRVINLKEGNTYRTIDREYTISHLMTLGAFKFVNIKFLESKQDSATLDANIYLTPFLKKSIRAEFQATSKSNNFVGPGLNVTFTNRNAFGGSERLDITLSSGYEVQISRKQQTPLNALELGGEAKLSAPRLIVPFNINYAGRRYLPSTHVTLATRIQQRINYFSLNSFNLSYGYTWRENTLKSHEFYPIDLSFVQTSGISDDFNAILDKNPFLRRSFDNQFIPGLRYVYTLNTQLNQERTEKYREQTYEPSHFFFTFRADLAGNIIHALQGENFKQDVNNEGEKILGSTYSQFSRGEIDARYYWQMDEKNMIVTRLNAGVGYAYGNSVTMPYIKQFAIGGSTSLRAFPARTIGPGTYYVLNDETIVNPPTQGDGEGENEETVRNFFIDQRGDIKIEGNVEYRYDLTKTIKTALFVDAGNIWLIRNDTSRPGGQFKRSQFLNELAVGTGVGLRFDFNFFVLRFDLAFPLRKPWEPAGERWVFDKIDFGSSQWRGDNLILNIAIGYPF